LLSEDSFYIGIITQLDAGTQNCVVDVDIIKM